MMMGTSIAIKYSCKRTQFGEKLIIDYLTQQRRLVPALATTYAFHFAMLDLKVGPNLLLCISIIVTVRVIILSVTSAIIFIASNFLLLIINHNSTQ